MDGRDVEQLVELSIDGELAPSEEADLAVRLTESPVARDRAERTKHFQLGLRDKLREASRDTMTPPGLQARVVYRLRREAEAEHERTFPWGRATAALLGVAVVALGSWYSTAEPMDVDDLVGRHTRNRPPEFKARGSLADVHRFLQPNLGYAVHVPPTSERNLVLVGARLASIRNHDAAHVMYDHRGARVSLFAYPEPHRVRLPETFRVRHLCDREVFIGDHRGYTVVSFADAGVMYALVSSLDPEQLVSFAADFCPSN